MKKSHSGLKLAICLFCLFIFTDNVRAQFTETVFYDTVSRVSKEGFVTGGYTEGKYMYLTGGSYSNQVSIPSLTKIDTSGDIVWTAIDPAPALHTEQKPDMSLVKGTTTHFLKDGNRIYTVSRNNQLWCIDDSSGFMIWNSKVPGDWFLKIVSFNDTELALLTGSYGLEYHIVNKATGNVVYSRRLVPEGVWVYKAELTVDDRKNILIGWGDTCYKYRDRYLDQLLWKSVQPPNFGESVDRIVQDSGRYILAGLNNVRAVDTLTGKNVWYNHVYVGYVPGEQGGWPCNVKKIVLRDSLMYITWTSPEVGGINLDRSFTLTCINRNNGHVKYNVAHDFNGVPADPPQAFAGELDWVMDFCFDGNGDIYLTGSYDYSAGMQNPGNWGVMKVNGATGNRIYEATITLDSLHRQTWSQGLFIGCIDGKLYAAGNLQRGIMPSYIDTKPVMVAFDDGPVYKERFRKSPFYTVRYPSSLTGVEPVGSSKMALLKMVGRSSVIELRGEYNQLLWSKSFSGSNKFMVPQIVRNLHDTAIAASFVLYKEEPEARVLPGEPDSVIFVCLDTLGNIKIRQQVPHFSTDSIAPQPVQVYTDAYNRTSFIYKRWVYNQNQYRYFPYYYGYMLGVGQDSWGVFGMGPINNAVLKEPIRKNVMSHYSADTLVFFYAASGYYSHGAFCSTIQNPTALPGYAGYTSFYTKRVRHFNTIYSSITVDSTSHIIFGTDSSGQTLAARYDFHKQDPLIWEHVQAAGSIITADTSSTHLYSVGRLQANNAYVISKINRSTGALQWNFQKTFPSQTRLELTDFRYDQVNQQFTVGGYWLDSSFGEIKSSYYYLTLDDNGAIVKEVVRTGDLFGQTQINTINTLQHGSHFYGGRLNTVQWGVAGFYNADCTGNIFTPSVSVNTLSNTVCPGATVTFTAIPLAGGTQPQYQWLLNNQHVGTGTDTFVTNTLQNNDKVSVQMMSNAACIQTNTASSNVINITLSTTIYPEIIISGKTTLYPGTSSQAGAVIANTKGNVIYQWQDSTQNHSWQNITNTGSGLLYTPKATGDKLRCMLYAGNDCVKSYIATSNVLTFVLDATTAVPPISADALGIHYYPNPVASVLIIDSLNYSDQWQTIEIVSMNGRSIQTVPVVQNHEAVSLNVAHLQPGVYIAILSGRRRPPVYLKFIKI